MCVCPSLDYLSFAKTKPGLSDMVGKYIPTANTLELMRDNGYYAVNDISVTLSADNTFTMTNMPDWWNTDFGVSRGGFDSGNGQWSIIEDQEWWSLSLDFDSRIDFNSEKSLEEFITIIPIAKNKPPYQLWFYIGDPDDEKIMIFERIQDKEQ